MSVDVQPSSTVGLVDLECLPTVDGDVGGSLFDFQPSSGIGLANLECLPTVDGDVAAGSSMSVGVQTSSTIAYNLLY